MRLDGLGVARCAAQVDSKKGLEAALKATCEAFIMGVTKATVEDMLSFITKVTAVKVASASSTAKPLRQQVRNRGAHPQHSHSHCRPSSAGMPCSCLSIF